MSRLAAANALIACGAVVGLTAMSWYLGWGEAMLTYLSLLGGHALVVIGYCIKPSVRRFAAMLVLVALMWWPAFLPAILGDHPWA